MSWLVWRQHRWDGASMLVVLLVLGGSVLVVTAVSQSALSAIDHACAARSPDCNALVVDYTRSFDPFKTFVSLAGMAAPALIGLFVGAPLIARELEQGTHLLVWAQGITRRRWFAAKVLILVSAAALSSGLLGVAFEMWLAPQASEFGIWNSFDISALVLIAYAVFALALGIAAGAVIQRTLPAMAVTLVAFIAIRTAVAQYLRPAYLPPLTFNYDGSFDASAADSNPWLIGALVPSDLSGHPISEAKWNDALQQCFANGFGGASLHQCLVDHGVRSVGYYQPGSRFWLFQGIEAVIFLALATMLVALTYRIVLRRL
jgi:ABC-2 family transporter protein